MPSAMVGITAFQGSLVIVFTTASSWKFLADRQMDWDGVVEDRQRSQIGTMHGPAWDTASAVAAVVRRITNLVKISAPKNERRLSLFDITDKMVRCNRSDADRQGTFCMAGLVATIMSMTA
eukprot:528116-Amphidinium_carterae.1